MAGTVGDLVTVEGFVRGAPSGVVGLQKTITADASAAGALPTATWTAAEIGGMFVGYSVKDGDTAPSEYSLSIKDKDGFELAACTAEGRGKPTNYDSEPIAGDITVSDAGSNTTNSGAITVTLYVVP